MAESRNLVPNSMRVPAMAAMDVKAGSVTVTVREREMAEGKRERGGGESEGEEECEWRFSNEFR